MLQAFGYSLPFLLIRIAVVALEGLTLYFSTILIHNWFIGFISGYVEGLFLTVVSPMGYIIGLALGALLVRYLLGFVHYYFKLANIIYITALVLEYPKDVARFPYALSQAATNFTGLALNDLTTRAIVLALKELKNAIVNNDFMSRFKDSQHYLFRFVKYVCGRSVSNVINMTDEIIVSYTWFVYDVYLEKLRKKKKEPKASDKLKNRALFMLEGISFTVRIFPKLMVNSLIYEVTLFLLAHMIAIGLIVLVFIFKGLSLIYIVVAIILYRTVIDIVYHAVIEALRLPIYIHSFYKELDKLEPFDIKEAIGNLLGKVPGLKSLVKASKQKIQATGSEGSPILEEGIDDVFKENMKEIGKAFDLKTSDLINDKEEPQSDLDESELEEEHEEEQEEQEEQPEQESELEEQPKVEETPQEKPLEPTIKDEDIMGDIDDMELEIVPPDNPFSMDNRITNQRRPTR